MGALTSKPYAFNARPWELRSFESVDFFDSVGASIRLDLRGLTLMRVLPYINESINEEWITDKVRFSYDGLKYQRLVAPLYRTQQKFVKLSWSQFYYQLISSLLRNRSSLGADLLVGQFIDSRSFLSIFSLLKTILSLRADKSKISIIHRELLSPSSSLFFSAYRSSYANFSWETLSKKKQLLLIDTNLRLESPLINLKVRRAVLNQGLNVYSFGFQSDLLYPVYNLGATTTTLVKFFEGRHALSRVIMNLSNSGLLLFYSHMTVRSGKEALLASFFKVISRISPFSLNAHYLNHSISTFGVLDMVGRDAPFRHKVESKKSILWCMGEDEICFDAKNYDTVIYSGHHGDRNAINATFLIPTTAPFEKTNHFVNILGANRTSTFVVNGPHLALSDEFFAYTFRSYIYSLLFSRASFNFDEKDMNLAVSPQFGFFNDFKGTFNSSFFDKAEYLSYASAVNQVSVDTSLAYYADNSVVRASHVMALAQSRFKRYKTNFHS